MAKEAHEKKIIHKDNFLVFMNIYLKLKSEAKYQQKLFMNNSVTFFRGDLSTCFLSPPRVLKLETKLEI